MTSRDKPLRYRQFGVAVLLTGLMLLVHWLLQSLLDLPSAYILFFLAITVSSWYGGAWPGITATALGALGVSYIAHTSQQPVGPVFLLIFVALGVLISVLQESLRSAQKSITQGAADLRESYERFHLLVDSIKDYGIFMLDPQGYILNWNAGAQNLKGYEAREIIGQHFSCFYPEEDIAAGKPEIELREATTHGRFESEGWRLRKDGTCFWANVVITAVYDQERQLRGFSKVTRDTTERKQAEERTELLAKEHAARLQAESANRAKDQFLSILSHELRTPLNAIMGWAHLLASGGLDEETSTHALEAIERNSKVQARLVEDLLDVSRMISGKLSIRTMSMEIAPVVQSVIDTLRPTAEEKDIELDMSSEPNLGSVSVDRVRLEQALWNLICNAIKFTPEGGRVVVQVYRADTEVEIVISDTGHGISPEALPFIFDHFRQADSSSTRRHGGLGLGLAIVRYIVEAHGGSVRAESSGEGEGATFIVRLPLLSVAPKAVLVAETSPTQKPSAVRSDALNGDAEQSAVAPLDGLRVLVVDDEAENRDVIETILTRKGAQVRAAASASTAMTMIFDWKPEVLLADIGMPDEDGYALISKVRSLSPDQGSGVPAVALTGYAGAAERVRSLASGFQEHLAKPVEPEMLTEVVARLGGRGA